MAKMMNIPIIAMVENMSYYKCPDCSSNHNIFGESKIDAVAKKHNIELVAKLPIDSNFSSLSDKGEIESYDGKELDEIVKFIEK